MTAINCPYFGRYDLASEEVLASTDRATRRTQDPQDGANQNEDATDRRQQAHADKQADDQQNKSENNHFETPSLMPAQAWVSMNLTTAS
ncbi:hypothetical protein [Streptomyces sp. NPDC021139]|uniref:hypothetical protein n=1 Tax=unclassified Streptomyces TaxID=2593676 RepID=UPI0018E3DC6B